ncbi:MAG: DUF2075 domain-containing protein [Lactobacillus sp.]|uniref:DUF2075 domain-containing protein n=1 Tax=Lactobacillus sp. TaxID=1591 RepID=UPI0023CFE428|nr:DUF2075 domain-containing protein [Lactobacillus sp.]MDE7050958.1 DUF2075 domain-containing protein [Lactobacillus sp.]
MQNKATDKLSPFKELTTEQKNLISQILNFTDQHLHKNFPAVFTIYGDAGTGKSVVLSSLFDQIQKMRHNKNSNFYQTNNYFLVNHPEILKVYRQIAGELPELLKKNFQRPTSFINQLDKKNEKADVVIIDEAHLLLSKPDHYNNFYHENQLVEIIKRSKIVVLVFDPYQVLKMKTLWTKDRLEKITKLYPHQTYYLKHQFRMNASPDLIDWFNSFTENQIIKPIPENAIENYDFRIFKDAEEMRKEIVKRNNEVGLSRILSTSGYPSTLDGGKHYIHEGKFKMPWDQYNYTATPWAEIPETINEVGSIYTCQGFDLNYTGIIIGPPISQLPNQNKIQVKLDKITDIEMFKKRKDLTDPDEIKNLEERMVLNSLNVLFKRGIKGTYLYAHDPLLRKTLVSMFKEIA